MSKAVYVLASLAAAYVAICALAYALQDALMFYPRPNHPGAVAELTGYSWKTDNQGVALTGWLRPAVAPAAAPLVLYFGGNAEDMAISAMDRPFEANVLYVNYRGYGSSAGRPSEAALKDDALAVFDAAAGAIVSNGTTIAMGRSLGSGVAVYLASRRPLDAVVLVTPFDTMVRVAGGHYPWLPVRWLLNHRFESVELAPEITIPALVLVAEQDRIVPPARGVALAQAWGGEATLVRFPHASHNDIHGAAGYTTAIADFLDSV